MKKILTALAFLTTFSTILSADFARIEVGVGGWGQVPDTSMVYKAPFDTYLGGNDRSNSDITAQTQAYAWLLVKHPIPIIPNVRLEYASISSTGTAQGTFHDFNIPSGQINSSIDITQIDVIPYYNILDNTAWITLDLGLDFKVMDTEYKVQSSLDPLFDGYSDTSSTIIPLLYVRARFEIPATDIGLEADVKYVTFDDNTVSDVRVKVDYTFTSIPIFEPAIELGYRAQSIYQVTDENLIVDMKFGGIYAGVMVRF